MEFIIWISIAIATAIVASNKGRGGLTWFLIGFVTGPVGLLISLVIKKDEKTMELDTILSGTRIKCPFCAEIIKSEAVVCRFCNRDLQATNNNDYCDVAVKSGEGSYPTEVVGESFYQKTLNSLCGGKIEEGHNKKVSARVLPDFKNKYDSNAYKVEIDGHMIGHLSRDAAKELKALVGNKTLKCPAIITGGWKRKNDEGNYGVKLDITW